MIAVDTNVLIRLLVEDDDAQTARAATLVTRAIERGESVFVPDVAMVEIAWVLRACYGLPRARIVEALHALLVSTELVFASGAVLGAALRRYADGKGDFADYVLLEQARQQRATPLYTFARAVAREPGFAGC